MRNAVSVLKLKESVPVNEIRRLIICQTADHRYICVSQGTMLGNPASHDLTYAFRKILNMFQHESILKDMSYFVYVSTLITQSLLYNLQYIWFPYIGNRLIFFQL